jgi:hypothetical protein
MSTLQADCGSVVVCEGYPALNHRYRNAVSNELAWPHRLHGQAFHVDVVGYRGSDPSRSSRQHPLDTHSSFFSGCIAAQVFPIANKIETELFIAGYVLNVSLI